MRASQLPREHLPERSRNHQVTRREARPRASRWRPRVRGGALAPPSPSQLASASRRAVRRGASGDDSACSAPSTASSVTPTALGDDPVARRGRRVNRGSNGPCLRGCSIIATFVTAAGARDHARARAATSWTRVRQATANRKSAPPHRTPSAWPTTATPIACEAPTPDAIRAAAPAPA
jgi:hypothetical protein